MTEILGTLAWKLQDVVNYLGSVALHYGHATPHGDYAFAGECYESLKTRVEYYERGVSMLRSSWVEASHARLTIRDPQVDAEMASLDFCLDPPNEVMMGLAATSLLQVAIRFAEQIGVDAFHGRPLAQGDQPSATFGN